MAMKDITNLMNSYRECSRNLWNTYFSQLDDVGIALDAFDQIKELLFGSLVLDQLSSGEKGETLSTTLKVVLRSQTSILISRPIQPSESRYWDEEKDMFIGPGDCELDFLDYFDFSQVPLKEFRYYRCKIVKFESKPKYEGREALVEVDEKVMLAQRDESQSVTR